MVIISGGKIIMENIYIGYKNALDFQLLTKLGILVQKNINNINAVKFYIVGNDSGYDVSVTMME